MSYADRLRQGIKGSTTGTTIPQHVNTPPPVENTVNEIPDEDDSPLPTPVEQPPMKSKPYKPIVAPAAAPVMTAPSIPTYSGNNGAVWQKLKGHKEATEHLARILGPQVVCSLGITCKDLFQKFFTPNLWTSVLQAQLPVTSKLQIKFLLEVPVDSEIGNELNDEAKENEEIETEGKTLRVPVSYFKREARCTKLVQFWMSLLEDAQKTRDSKHKDEKDEMKKPPLQVTLGGGLSIIKQKGKEQEVILRTKDLSLVIRWLDATVKLLEGKNSMELPYGKGKVTISRMGRGSTILVINVGGTSHYFELKDFSVEIRARTIDFSGLIGRSYVALKRHSKDISFPNPEQVQKLLEQEEKLKDILKFQEFDGAIKRIQVLLKNGAIPRSDLPEYFAAKSITKEKHKQQLMMEHENVLEFVMSNLPPDFEEAKANAKKQNQEVIDRRIETEKEIKRKKEEYKEMIEKKKKKEERAASFAQMQQHVEFEQEEAAKKKVKTVLVKKTDKHGWVTEQKTRVDPFTNLPEVVPVKEKKEAKKIAKMPKVQKPLQEVNRQSLATNPFAPALQEHSYDSILETQVKKQAMKVKSKELAKEKQVQTPPPKESPREFSKETPKDSTKENQKTKKPKDAPKTKDAPIPAPKQPKKQQQQQKQSEIKIPTNSTKPQQQKPVQPKQKEENKKKPQNAQKGGEQKKKKTAAGKTPQKAVFQNKFIQPVGIVVSVLILVIISYFFVFS